LAIRTRREPDSARELAGDAVLALRIDERSGRSAHGTCLTRIVRNTPKLPNGAVNARAFDQIRYLSNPTVRAYGCFDRCRDRSGNASFARHFHADIGKRKKGPWLTVCACGLAKPVRKLAGDARIARYVDQTGGGLALGAALAREVHGSLAPISAWEARRAEDSSSVPQLSNRAQRASATLVVDTGNLISRTRVAPHRSHTGLKIAQTAIVARRARARHALPTPTSRARLARRIEVGRVLAGSAHLERLRNARSLIDGRNFGSSARAALRGREGKFSTGALRARCVVRLPERNAEFACWARANALEGAAESRRCSREKSCSAINALRLGGETGDTIRVFSRAAPAGACNTS